MINVSLRRGVPLAALVAVLCGGCEDAGRDDPLNGVYEMDPDSIATDDTMRSAVLQNMLYSAGEESPMVYINDGAIFVKDRDAGSSGYTAVPFEYVEEPVDEDGADQYSIRTEPFDMGGTDVAMNVDITDLGQRLEWVAELDVVSEGVEKARNMGDDYMNSIIDGYTMFGTLVESDAEWPEELSMD